MANDILQQYVTSGNNLAPGQERAVLRGTSGVAGVAPPSAKPTFRFYVYPTVFSGLVVPASYPTAVTNFIRIDAKYRFIAYGIAARFYNPTSGAGIGISPQNVELRVSDTASGRYFSNAPIKIAANTGNSAQYFMFPVPMILEKNTKLQLDLYVKFLTVATPDLWVAFLGAQIAQYGS